MTPKFRLVFFDVDSTLVTIEGIDVLAAGNPVVVRLIEKAMNGEVALDQVYARRLDMIRPTRASIETLAQRYLDSLVTGAEDTIRALVDTGCIVHLITAGIEQALTPLATKLRVALHAVPLRFSAAGDYEDFDRKSPLTHARGKEVVVRDIRARTKGKAAFIGDGASDLEAKPAVDLFIGFGGVHTRPRVRENADVFVAGPGLNDILPYLI